jgi:hypothetical protein
MTESYLYANFEPDVMEFTLSQRVHGVSTTSGDIITKYVAQAKALNGTTSPKNADGLSSHDSGLNGGAIAGIATGVVVVILFVILSYWWFVRRRRGRRAGASTSQAEKDQDLDPKIVRASTFDGADEYGRYEVDAAPTGFIASSRPGQWSRVELPTSSFERHELDAGSEVGSVETRQPTHSTPTVEPAELHVDPPELETTTTGHNTPSHI